MSVRLNNPRVLAVELIGLLLAATTAWATVSIAPTSASVAVSHQIQFQATVSGQTDTSVTWSVDGIAGGNTTVGTVDPTGLYTAPSTTGSHTVTATSAADPTQSASAAVNVTIYVAINPTTASVIANQTKQFQAIVQGTTNTGVKWSVDGVIGGTTTSGTISTSGLYTAPGTTGTHTVTITSNAEPSQTASAMVTITQVAIAISPTSATVITGQTKQFASTVTGTTNTGVKWSVDGVIGGSSSSGTISTSGLYTAPTTAGSHTVTVTSAADPTKSASASVTVTQVSIAIIPTSATVTGGSTKQFQATISGTTNLGVSWSVDGIVGGNTTVGTIYTTGLYTAPNASGAHTVTATSVADRSKSASASVTISPNIYVVINPVSTCLGYNQSTQFRATVYGTSNNTVTWQVNGATGGNGQVGTITSSGVYTAPARSGTYTVRAVSNANNGKTASSSVKVQNGVTISIVPSTAYYVPASQSQILQSSVCGSSNTGVNWYVDNIAGGNPTVGTISPSGTYSAPPAAGVHAIKAVSQANTSKSASVTVNVFSGIAADFGSRAFTSYPVPNGMFNAQLTNVLNSSAMGMLTQAGLKGVRLLSNLPAVYKTQTPDWTQIDPMVSKIQAAGMTAILEITYTPSWLVPSVTGCTPSYKMPPSNYAAWAKLAAAFVAHMDQNFPGVVTDYEIWNEPDLTTFCVYPNDNSTRLSTYLNLYAAAAAQMKAQAALDGSTIRIGGPTIVNSGSISTWIPGLVGNSNTAPYVDFVSYHQYLAGTFEAQQGMTWDTSLGTPRPLYARTQDPYSGPAAIFQKIAAYVKQGIQANPSQTPIYLDEYNDDFAFVATCCRNDSTYSPVFNSLSLVDLLNSVYSGAQAVPGKYSYYSSNNFPYYCLVGMIDVYMDCANQNVQPYPQYYAYSLLAGPQYLGLGSGGYLAKSVFPPVGQSGLAVTAFYTGSLDAIVIVNPTGTPYSQLSVTAQNPGFTTASGTLYVLNQANPKISSQGLAVTLSNGNMSSVVDVPAYSVVAITITP